jgi:DNA-binding transcriptional LysR family regulator
MANIDLMDIRSFDLNLLRTLDALLTEASVTGAAQRLNLSQPAVSGALARLRSALNDRLLVRHGQRLLLTPRAEALRLSVRRILEDIQRSLAAQDSFEPATCERRFRLAATDYAAFVVVVPLVRTLRARSPGIAIDILPLDERVADQLASGSVDLALGGAWWLRRAERRTTLFREEFVGLARADHPGLSRVPTLDEYAAADHVLISYRGRVPGIVDDMLAKLGRSRRVALTLPHFMLAPYAVVQTDLVLTTGRRIAEMFAEKYALRRFPPPLPIEPAATVLAWHGRTDGDPALAWLRAQIQAL